MKINSILSLLLATTFCTSCIYTTREPAPYGAIPTQAQLNWHQMEYFSLICYGLNTYTEQEWAYGDVDPNIFNPKDLDTDQWAETAQKAGMKGLILVAKHHDGFCLWPSQYTHYSVAATPWKAGKGDVLKDLSLSCKKYGLKLGVYLSPWDRNHKEYGRPEYVQYYYKQLKELLTEYGEVFEFWIDGANGGTGYYGGANENRKIDRQTYYGYDNIFDMVKTYQPNAVIFSDVGPGCRWVGNEAGIGSETNWNTINTEGKFPGYSDPAYHKQLGTGEKGASNWTPAEVNTTLLWPKAWYYHTGYKPRPVSNLMDLYYTSIGCGSPLNLGLAITPEGKVSYADSLALINFRKRLNLELKNNLVLHAKIEATDTRGNSKKYSVDNLLDKNTETYWASNENVHSATIRMDFGQPTVFNRLLLQEHIALGQRIHQFKLEIRKEDKWQEVLKGTTVGYKRVLKFDNVKTTSARITLETDATCLTLSNLGIYQAPPMVKTPNVHADINGNITLQTEPGVVSFYRIGKSSFRQYSSPIHLPRGGNIETYASDKMGQLKSETISQKIGIAKKDWKVHHVSSEQEKSGKAIYAFDRNKSTLWISENTNKEENHFIAIDLGSKINISGFSYLPCLNACDGVVYKYEVFLSKDGENWGAPVSFGEFSNIQNNPVEQIITFEETTEARFIKFVAQSSTNESKLISAAEIEIFTEE